jgi:hypothetical protein
MSPKVAGVRLYLRAPLDSSLGVSGACHTGKSERPTVATSWTAKIGSCPRKLSVRATRVIAAA